MKRLLPYFAFAYLVVLFLPSVSLAQPGVDSTFQMGINWFSLDTTYDDGNWRHLWHDDLKINIMHVGLERAHDWVQAGGKEGLIGADTLSLDRFSHSGIMVYTPLSKPLTGPSAADTLTKSYFIGLKKSYGSEDTLFGNHYWVDSLSASHTDVVILDSNEILNGPGIFQRMFRSNSGQKFKVAIKMNVADTNTSTSNTQNAVEIWVKLFRWDKKGRTDGRRPVDVDSVDSFLVHKEFIPWREFTQPNVDMVFFTPDNLDFTFFRDTIIGGVHDSVPVNLDFKDTTWYLTDVQLEVHSQRYVTTRIAWVSIQDINADS